MATVEANDLCKHLRNVLPDNLELSNTVFVCIGTDRSTGDSLGPLVGTYLEKMGFTNVLGTLEHPVHAANLQDRLDEIEDSKKVIAIDACLGQPSSVGTYQAAKGPIRPGAGVDKDLGCVGDYHITGIVNVGGFMEYLVLQNTRLSLIIRMAEVICEAITNVFSQQLHMEAAAAKED